MRTKSGAIKVKIDTRYLKAVAKRAIKRVKRRVKRAVKGNPRGHSRLVTSRMTKKNDWVWFQGKDYAVHGGGKPSERWDRLSVSHGLASALKHFFMLGYRAGKVSKRK